MKKIDQIKERHRKQRRHDMIMNTLKISAIVIVMAVAAVFGYANHKLSLFADSYQKAENVKKFRSSSDILNQKKPFSILLLSTDSDFLGRNSSNYQDPQTDSIMLVTVNPKTKTTTLNSIPRDSLVGYQDQDNDTLFPRKINSAYSVGGVSKVINLVQDWSGVPIDYYAVVNMSGMISLVDDVGGVSVPSISTFTFSQETAHETGKQLYKFHQGSNEFEYSENGVDGWVKKTTMNGQDALAYSRARYMVATGDYERQARQRQILTEIIKKSANTKNFLNESLIKKLSSSYRSDLSTNDMMTIIQNYMGAKDNIKQTGLQGSNAMIDGISYEFISKDAKTKFFKNIADQLGITPKSNTRMFGGVTYKYSYNPVTGDFEYDKNSKSLGYDTDSSTTSSSTTDSSSESSGSSGSAQ